MDTPPTPPCLPPGFNDGIRGTCREIHHLLDKIVHLEHESNERDDELAKYCSVTDNLVTSLENRLNNQEQDILNFFSRLAPSTRNRRRVEMNILEEQKALEEHTRKVAEFTAWVLENTLEIVDLHEDVMEMLEVLEDGCGEWL